MEKFQDLLLDTENQKFEKILIYSDSPILGISGETKKEISAGLSAKDLLAILKNSVPAEVLAGLGWGKSNSAVLISGYKIDIAFTVEKTIKVELVKERVKKVEATTKNIVEVDPQVLDNLLEADVLVYYSSSSEPKVITEMLTRAGYNVRASNNAAACCQALNYKEYTVFGMIIESDYLANQVLNQLQWMQMQSRRRQFSFLISANLETGNPDLAYGLSVSLVGNISEINTFEQIFLKTMPSWKRVVDSFQEAINATG